MNLRKLLFVLLVSFFANLALESPTYADGSDSYGCYDPDYPFGENGDADNPHGSDGYPGDTPPGTPGAPPATRPMGSSDGPP